MQVRRRDFLLSVMFSRMLFTVPEVLVLLLFGSVVFGVKNDLVSRVEKRTDASMPDGKPAEAPWYLMRYEFRLKPGTGAAPTPMMAATEGASA